MIEHAILIADDNPHDVALVRRFFLKSRVLNPLKIVHDGVEAIDYLKGEGKYADRIFFPYPGLLLLDLKMPRKSGWDVLVWIQEQEPPPLGVVVLSGADDVHTIGRAYKLGADSFLVKPLLYDDFLNLITWVRTSPERSNTCHLEFA
jgi:CheY-like chemotaxis protein